MKRQITPQPIRNPLARWITLGVSSGLGLGYAPVAPGTFGSLLGIPLGLYLLTLPTWMVMVIFVGLFFVFAALAERACLHWGQTDSGRVVSDEVLGQAIAIFGIRSVIHEGPVSQWIFVAVAFGLFRLFDIVKPFPAKTFDRQESGIGVIADDVVAGLYAALVVLAVSKIWLNQPI